MDRNLTRISIVLAALGVLVSAYMTVYKLTDNQTMCLGDGGCSVVNSSAYSEVYGIPVALVGFAGYLVILAVLAIRIPWQIMRQNAVLIGFGLCLAGFLFTAYLIYVEIVLIRALCPFCVASQVIMTALFALSVVRLIREPAH
ncbi:MAG TPA: vitamin K epoxide reductase family protein [Anaerolineales bacterium]|nr:vitamin K epoxide reductase family protein [Anaerolineales bacterium]